MVRRLGVILAAFSMLAVLSASPATAGAELHPGMTGKRVCAAKWLLSGHRPSHYRWLHPYSGRIAANGRCYYGRSLGHAVHVAKRKLGYPRGHRSPVYGYKLDQYLRGQRARPLSYVARAAAVRRIDARRARANTYGARMLRLARGQIGCREWDSSNNSSCVRQFQHVTGAYYAPWCASFVQWALAASGIGTIANRSAGVFYIVGYARARGWLRASPRPGYLVAFMHYLGHIGIVERSTTSGIYSIEGNTSNGVYRRYHYRYSTPMVYIAVPGVTNVVRTVGGGT